MEIHIPQDGITTLLDKLSEKIFAEVGGPNEDDPFKVHFNQKIGRRLRQVVFDRLLSHQGATEQDFNVKERLCIVGYKLKAHGLASKAYHLEKLFSNLG